MVPLYDTYIPEIQAHRGAKGDRVENTIEAFKEAIRQEADTIELDLQLTNDNKLIVNHDFDIPDPREMNKKKLIKNLNYSEILEISKVTQNSYQEELYPLLSEVFDWFKKEVLSVNNKKILDLEIKFDKKLSASSKALTGLLSKLIAEFDINDNIRVRSFYPRIIWQLKKKFPKDKIILLTDKRMRVWVTFAKVFGIKIVAPNINRVSKRRVQLARALGLKVFVWGANEIADFQKLISYKVDAITTDYPQKLKAYLSQKHKSNI